MLHAIVCLRTFGGETLKWRLSLPLSVCVFSTLHLLLVKANNIHQTNALEVILLFFHFFPMIRRTRMEKAEL